MSQGELCICPVCGNEAGGHCRKFATGRDAAGYDCDNCGRFVIAGSAEIEYFYEGADWSPMQRWALSHRLATTNSGRQGALIDSEMLGRLKPTLRSPTPPEQATNFIRLVGDYEAKTGQPYPLIAHRVMAKIGCAGILQWTALSREMKDHLLHIVPGVPVLDNGIQVHVNGGTLTFKGWERYNLEQKGRVAGRYGFIAMKFGAPELEVLVNDTIRPDIKAAIGYDVVDLRQVARAGVIDNLLREQIRDSAFVLADLTHDNYGAYWEAGYAEGLGKPVIYICEQQKFDTAKTHFDTNHCTTVMWDQADLSTFSANLVATVRRSLNLFATG